MKKILVFILAVVLSLGALAISAGAFLGTGAQVIAEDVKMIKTGLAGHKMTFTDGDFKSALCLSDFEKVKVTKIPTSLEGTLLLGGRRVSEGKEIQRKNIGGLVFVPASKSVSECSFKFTVDGGCEVECILKFTDKVNYAPECDDIATVKTQENISVFGNLSATDPEGDSLEYIVVSYPTSGRVCMLDGGRFSYTPTKDYTGEDKFSFVVRDVYGNYSSPVSVKLEISERLCDVEYIDMEERAEYNAAVAMTALGIMGGDIVGDDVYFNPDRTVTRAEFVSLAMKCAGIRADSTISASYFDDDADIPASLKPYVATAQRIGLIVGDFNGENLLFKPNETLTKYEAATIMAAIVGLTGNIEEDVFATAEEIPLSARQAVYAMCSVGIFESDGGLTAGESVCRADAAEYLYRMNIYRAKNTK